MGGFLAFFAEIDRDSLVEPVDANNTQQFDDFREAHFSGTTGPIGGTRDREGIGRHLGLCLRRRSRRVVRPVEVLRVAL